MADTALYDQERCSGPKSCGSVFLGWWETWASGEDRSNSSAYRRSVSGVPGKLLDRPTSGHSY